MTSQGRPGRCRAHCPPGPADPRRPQAWLPGSPGLQGGREPAGEAGRESPTFGIIHVVTVTLADVCERNFLFNTEGN